MDIEKIDKNFVDHKPDENGMVWYNALEAPFEVFGVSFDKEMGRLMRMPQKVAASVNDGVKSLASCTAGGRVRFYTDSDTVAIRSTLNSVSRMSHMAFTGSAGYSLYADLDDGTDRWAAMYVVDQKEDKVNISRVVSENVRRLSKRVVGYTLFMPLYSGVTDLEIGVKEGSVIAKSGLSYRDIKPVLYYGHSITQGACASRPGADCNSIISRRLNVDFINLGFSGSARGEQTMSDYLATFDPSIFFLDYDWNAPTVEHLAATHYPMYATIRNARPDTPIVFMTSTDYETHLATADMRYDVIAETYSRGIAAGDKHLYLVDGRRLMDGPERDDCTVDGCHPTDLGFRRMADRLTPLIARILDIG